jgi:hypothetical protein
MFNEANTVEDYLCHLLSGTTPTATPGRSGDVGGAYTVLGRNRSGAGPPKNAPTWCCWSTVFPW